MVNPTSFRLLQRNVLMLFECVISVYMETWIVQWKVDDTFLCPFEELYAYMQNEGFVGSNTGSDEATLD